MRTNAQPNGVRHLERDAPSDASRMKATVAGYDAGDILKATRECVSIYRAFQDACPEAVVRRTEVEARSISYLRSVHVGVAEDPAGLPRLRGKPRRPKRGGAA